MDEGRFFISGARWCAASSVIATLLLVGTGGAFAQAALELEAKIPLGDVSGRIDHLAVDVAGQRLFVAELGNDSVGVVDLRERKLLQRIGKLSEPQGVGYLPPPLDTLVVANAHDGSVRFFSGPTLAPAGRVELGDDADNVRVLPGGRGFVVGYGSGALALIDGATRAKQADITLKDHPEAFQLDPAGPRVFVNVPDAREIAVVDRAAGRQVARWTVPGARANFPMALVVPRREVAVVFRSPARLAILRADDGAVVANPETCGDADDVFHDARRDRLYVTCGDGAVDVFDVAGGLYRHLSRLKTVSGARTGLLVAELDRLFVAVRARGGEPAAIWVFRPI
jgi:DNA-binding beta-propeller fold protein YncE